MAYEPQVEYAGRREDLVTLTLELDDDLALKARKRFHEHGITLEQGAVIFNRRCAGYKALGYEIVMPLSAASGLPSNVSILREKKLDETYSESVKRL